MGNMQNESDFNIETNAVDSNGARAYGLISWNAASYPNASSLVTGNTQKDLADQINFLLHDTSGTSQGLQGQTAAEVAGNWAQFVEVCQGCQPGGAQWTQRQENANQILNSINTGNWGPGGSGISGASNTQNAVDTGIFNSSALPFPFDIPGILGNILGGGNSPTGSLTTGIGEGIASGLAGGFVSITNTMLQKLGFTGWKDFFIRIGLIGLGVIILIIGLTHLTNSSSPVSLSLPAPPSGENSESADGTSVESRNSGGRKTGNNATRPRKSTRAISKTDHGRAGLKTDVSSATKKVGKSAAEMAAIS